MIAPGRLSLLCSDCDESSNSSGAQSATTRQSVQPVVGCTHRKSKNEWGCSNHPDLVWGPWSGVLLELTYHLVPPTPAQNMHFLHQIAQGIINCCVCVCGGGGGSFRESSGSPLWDPLYGVPWFGVRGLGSYGLGLFWGVSYSPLHTGPKYIFLP